VSSLSKSMVHYPDQIEYSDKYSDDIYDYRHVHLPKVVAKLMVRAKNGEMERLLTEKEWRALGVIQSRGWEHYEIHRPEPHILLFRRPLGVDPQTGMPTSFKVLTVGITEVAADALGMYQIVKKTLVTKGIDRDTCQRVAELSPGALVHVREIVHAAERIRARIIAPDGWISLRDTDGEQHWAEQADASAIRRISCSNLNGEEVVAFNAGREFDYNSLPKHVAHMIGMAPLCLKLVCPDGELWENRSGSHIQ